MRGAVTATLLGFIAIAPEPPAQVVLRPNLESERALLHYRLGLDLWRSERYSEAANEFQQTLKDDKSFKLAYYWLGRSYMSLRRYAEALASYETCRNLYQNQISRKFGNIAEADHVREQDRLQLEIAIQQLQSRSQTEAVHYQIQQLQNQLERIQMRRDASRNVDIVVTTPAFVSVAIGSAYFRMNRLADAEREYKSAIDDDAGAGEAHNNLAVVYMMTGRVEDAAREVALAEKGGFRVSEEFKRDLTERRRKPSD